ncbi:MAG TPA: HAD-IC family P-type ATPase [Clostridia bacterium]|nr:HAD-IC family P-type ATPase [Clostridia bacterium]
MNDNFTLDNVPQGLSEAQAAELAAQGKTNYVKKTVGKSYASIILDNVLTMFNLVGLVVFILLAIAGDWKNTMFCVVILANTFIGIIQEIRAKVTVQKLSILTSANATVIRDGKENQIAVGKLVLGDVIKLKVGNQIPADSEVLQGYVETNEALLTGESHSVKKNTGDTLLSGSFVVAGNCFATVNHIGAENYVEQLAIKAKKYKKPKSELMRSINGIIKIIAIVVFPLGLASFLMGFYANAKPWTEALARACGSMIGMIPSGMVLLTSVTLAVSVIKMVRKKALVQDLYCIEMLARVDVLCLDKTGTITDGTMTVGEIEVFDQSIDVGQTIADILAATGDSNDTAKALLEKFVCEKTNKPTSFLPFSSERKMSGATFGGITYLLGASEFILPKDHTIEKITEKYSEKGMRALLLAKADGTAEKPENIKPVALIALSDTLRSDASDIIDWFKQNQVGVRVISGDNAKTVSVIAEKAGILNAEKFISLDGLSDEEVIEAVKSYTVFGRVTPEQKALIIKTLKEQGNTVAMTGDGVNDILAMKQADCAVAIAAGSDAAKSAAHLVLLDSKFSSMPDVVKEGRQVVNNIQNSTSLFLMKTIMTMFTTILMLVLGKVYPLEPQNLYVIEFFVIGIPAFFLALRHNESLIKGKFLRNILASTLPKGIALATSVALVYIFANMLGIGSDERAITMTVMLAITYSGLVGLITLCMPFTKISFGVSAGSLIISTLAFWILNKYLDYHLYLMTNEILIFLVITVAVSILIIAVGRIIEEKNKKEKLNAKIS